MSANGWLPEKDKASLPLHRRRDRLAGKTELRTGKTTWPGCRRTAMLESLQGQVPHKQWSRFLEVLAVVWVRAASEKKLKVVLKQVSLERAE